MRRAMLRKHKIQRYFKRLLLIKRGFMFKTLRTSTIKVTKPKISVGEGLAILIGTQIGAGVLGLPYAAAQVGLIPAIIILFGIMGILLLTALLTLKLSVEMGGAQMSTIAYRTLGSLGGWIMYLSISVMSFGALLAYISGMGSVMSSLFSINTTLGALIFWIFASIIIYMGIEASGKTELIMNYVMILLFIGVIIMLVPHANVKNALYVKWGGIFAITGVSIFALGCHMVIPDVYKGIGDYNKTKRVIVLSFLIPTIIYSLFMAAFLLVYGTKTPQIATQALSSFYGKFGEIVGNVIPFIAIITSYIGVGLAQQSNSVEYINMKKWLAWSLTVLPPLLVYLLGISNFTYILAFAGSTGDLTAFIILPLAMWLVKWLRNYKKIKIPSPIVRR